MTIERIVSWSAVAALMCAGVACGSDDGDGGTTTSTSSTGGTGGMGGAGTGGMGGTGTGGMGGTGTGGTGGGIPTGPSCDGLVSNCGPGANEDCCTSLTVAGGTYFRSHDGIDYTDQGYPATVSSFALDRFEVTVGRFRAFVNAGMGTQASPPNAGDGAHPLIGNSGWDAAWNSSLPANTTVLTTLLVCSTYKTWTETPGSGETLPINCVNWYEAFAFCAWDGGRLPTDAEWNYAAAGGDEQRYYPWSVPYPPGSTTIDPTYAVYDCAGDGSAAGDCELTDMLMVGSRSPKGDGRWGQADLGGSVLEWNLDGAAYHANPCSDCANLTATTYRVLRGGTWYIEADHLRAAYRFGFGPDGRTGGGGLRCARTP